MAPIQALLYLHDELKTGGGTNATGTFHPKKAPESGCASAVDHAYCEHKMSSSSYKLTCDDVAELEEATRRFQESGMAVNRICRESFPLPTLAAKARAASVDVHNQAKGFALFSGLKPGKYTAIQNIIMHAGLASHVGNERAMAGMEDGSRMVLHHITDLDKGDTKGRVGLANQSAAIPFHTDPGHILSFFTLSSCASGGSLYLASAAMIYQQMKRQRPDLVEILENDWAMVSFDLQKDSEHRPILYAQGERVIASLLFTRILGKPTRPRPSNLPAITDEQHEALKELDRVAREVATKIDQQPGDMLFFNNLGMLHSRDAFVDDEASGSKRHMLHLVIRDEEQAWKVPVQLANQHQIIYDHNADEEIFEVREVALTDAAHP